MPCKQTDDYQQLLIAACPYCGSSDVHEVNRVGGMDVESVAVSCFTCDEDCVIDRNLDAMHQLDTVGGESTMNKVRAGLCYFYHPVGYDRFDAPYDAQDGDILRVVNMPGCPPANTMGHCHVEHLDGRFAGLVCCNSLSRLGVCRECGKPCKKTDNVHPSCADPSSTHTERRIP